MWTFAPVLVEEDVSAFDDDDDDDETDDDDVIANALLRRLISPSLVTLAPIRYETQT